MADAVDAEKLVAAFVDNVGWFGPGIISSFLD